MVDMGRTAKGLTALGILTAGVVVGAVAERLATRRLREGEFVGIEAAGGHSVEVVTDDGVSLHVVVYSVPARRVRAFHDLRQALLALASAQEVLVNGEVHTNVGEQRLCRRGNGRALQALHALASA